MTTRSPICSVLGHVDHGKSSILDRIRGSAITAREAGGITQAIGASIIPFDVIQKICGDLLKALKIEFTIPGLLFIDTPGHAAFTSLRKRGGALADIAIVVIDINEGFRPQTKEAIEILKASKTPFIIAANKLDLVPNWRRQKELFLADIAAQQPDVVTAFEKRLYEIVGSVHEHFGLSSERFDRVDDYTKQLAIVPCSAKSGEGIAELIMVITGLAQKFLEKNLDITIDGPGKGSILEVKEEKGLGTTMDVIVYDGTFKVNDQIVIGGIDGPIVTKVRALFEPAPMEEMRDTKSKFTSIKSVSAAIGVKIAAPNTDDVMSGMPIFVASDETLEDVKHEVQNEVEDVFVETDDTGLIIKADTLGALEAIIMLLKEKDIPVRKASIGDITKKDVVEAETNVEKDPLLAVILGFNVSAPIDVKQISRHVHVFTSDVIYRLLDEYDAWKTAKSKAFEAKELDGVVRPCKLKVMSGYVFRQSNPAVLGCEILLGTARTGMPIMKDGKTISSIKAMQKNKENVSSAKKDIQLAISLVGVTVGRQVNEGDTLYSGISEEEFRKLKELKKHLTPDETECAKEIAVIMRKGNPIWGI